MSLNAKVEGRKSGVRILFRRVISMSGGGAGDSGAKRNLIRYAKQTIPAAEGFFSQAITHFQARWSKKHSFLIAPIEKTQNSKLKTQN